MEEVCRSGVGGWRHVLLFSFEFCAYEEPLDPPQSLHVACYFLLNFVELLSKYEYEELLEHYRDLLFSFEFCMPRGLRGWASILLLKACYFLLNFV